MKKFETKSKIGILNIALLCLLAICVLAVGSIVYSGSWLNDDAETSSSGSAGRIILGVNESSSHQNIISQSVLDGSISLVSDVSLEVTAESQSAYGRIYAEFLGTDSTAYTLNHDLTTYENSVYYWERIGQYYYLMDKADSQPLVMTVGTTYTFLEKSANTFSVNPSTNDDFNLNAKVIQSANNAVNSAASLATLLGDDIAGIKNIDLNVSGNGSVTPIPSYTKNENFSFTIQVTEDYAINKVSINNENQTITNESNQTFNIETLNNVSIDIEIIEVVKIKLIYPENTISENEVEVIYNSEKTKFKIIYKAADKNYNSITNSSLAGGEFYFFTAAELGSGANQYNMHSSIEGNSEYVNLGRNLTVLNTNARYDASNFSIDEEVDIVNDKLNEQYWFDMPPVSMEISAVFAVPNIKLADVTEREVEYMGGEYAYQCTEAFLKTEAILSNGIVGSIYGRTNNFFNVDRNQDVTSVLLSTSIKRLERRAFAFVEEIEYFNLPPSIDMIGEMAFNQCIKLKNINIPENTEIIEKNAFWLCYVLEEIDLKNVKTIGISAFSNCYLINEVVIPESVTEIGEYAFSQTAVVNVLIPETVTTFNVNAFHSCVSLKKIEIKAIIENFETYSLEGCLELEEIILSEGVTNITLDLIYEYAEHGLPKLKKINVPSSVTSIMTMGWDEFGAPPVLEYIDFAHSNWQFTSMDNPDPSDIYFTDPNMNAWEIKSRPNASYYKAY